MTEEHPYNHHLGNVLSTISDRKIAVAGTAGLLDHWRAEVRSFTDYYPFGMQMDARTGFAEGYRWGFQGQEKDDEIKGSGNSINYKYRMHDPRIGRFFAVDPMFREYPWNSPYAFSKNRVIDGVELEGLEFSPAYFRMLNTVGRTQLGLQGAGNILFGTVGAIGSGYYIAQTGGTGAAFGGGLAMSLSLGEVGIGISHLAAALMGSNSKANQLSQFNSIPGAVAIAQEANPSIVRLVDAGGQLLPGTLSGGNIKTIIQTPLALRNSTNTSEATFNLLNGVDALMDVSGAVSTTLDAMTPTSSVSAITSSTSSTSFTVGSRPRLGAAIASAYSNMPNQYTVKSGDNLSSIASRYNTTVDAIASQNNISDVNHIEVGQELTIY